MYRVILLSTKSIPPRDALDDFLTKVRIDMGTAWYTCQISSQISA